MQITHMPRPYGAQVYLIDSCDTVNNAVVMFGQCIGLGAYVPLYDWF